MRTPAPAYAKQHRRRSGTARPSPPSTTIKKAGNDVFELTPQEHEELAKAAAKPAYDAWIAEMNKLGRPGQKMFDDLLVISAKYGRK